MLASYYILMHCRYRRMWIRWIIV